MESRIPQIMQGAGFLVIISLVAIGFAIASYLYSTYSAELIAQKSSADMDRAARIQTSDIGRILESKIGDVRNNLELISKSNRVQTQNVTAAAPIFAAGQDSTNEFTDSYFWIDRDGKLLWANSFSSQAVYQQYSGKDLSDTSYFTVAQETQSFHVSSVVSSADGLKRIYFAYPIFSEDGKKVFQGAVVASANLSAMGNYLKSQLSPETQGTIGLLSRDATILYSENPDLIGLNYYGEEFQGVIPGELRQYFNAVIHKSLVSKTVGQERMEYQGSTGSITFAPILVEGASVSVLYLGTSHSLAAEARYLLDSQNYFTVAFIAALAGLAIVAAVFFLKWNRTLVATVVTKTSQLKHANQELEKALADLKSHERMQKEFINIAAHELRTPVQPILAMAEIAENKALRLPENEDRGEIIMSKNDFEMITRNARRLERLSTDILEVARIESQSLKLKKEVFDINEKIIRVIQDIRITTHRSKAVDINFEPSDTPILVNADRTKIFEVLSNLIVNALKFTERGNIRVTARTEDENVIIRVKDSGSGIAPEIQPKLFTRFTTNSFTGTGLGLYIAKAIIEAHGGRIWGENNPNGLGATFSFKLPLEQVTKLENIERASWKDCLAGFDMLGRHIC